MNSDQSRLFHQWECLKCHGHGLLVSCVKRPKGAGSTWIPSPKSDSCWELSCSKSRHGGKAPTFEPQGSIKIWLIIIISPVLIIYVPISAELVLRVGSGFLFDPTLNTSFKPHLQRLLPCRNPYHTWHLWLGTPCEVVSPHFYALNGWDCTNWPELTWDLGLGTPCEPALSVSYKFFNHGVVVSCIAYLCYCALMHYTDYPN